MNHFQNVFMDKYAVSIPKRFQLVTLDAGGKFQNS